MSIKISIIGAGSAVFSLGMIKDICLTPNLQGSVISFMDIDPDRLDSAFELCQRYADEIGINLKLEKTLNRRESLKNADFVINTALPGGHQRLRDGWSVAMNNNYHFGGSLHILHDECFWINFYQFRLMESILLDMMELCPDAWYLLVANPVLAGVTYLQRKYPKAKIIGLCHGYAGIFKIAEVLGLDKTKITYELPGLNHFIWLTNFNYEGKNAFPLLDQWIEDKAEAYWQTCSYSDALGPKAVDLYKRYGAFPIGDTGNPGGGSWGNWYHSDSETEKKWKEDPYKWYYDDYFVNCEKTVKEMSLMSKDKSIKLLEKYPPKHSDEQMIPIIESISCDIPRVFIVNILNSRNFVPGIPLDFEVETPALVSSRGVQGIQTNGLPEPLLQYAMRDRVAPVEIELEAFITGNGQRLLDLIMMDPWNKSEEQARNLLKEILALPYHNEMRKHYKIK